MARAEKVRRKHAKGRSRPNQRSMRRRAVSEVGGAGFGPRRDTRAAAQRRGENPGQNGRGTLNAQRLTRRRRASFYPPWAGLTLKFEKNLQRSEIGLKRWAFSVKS